MEMPIILNIDDDENICTLVRRFLEPEGYKVLAAGSGEVAMEMVQQTMPDLVLLDGLMPGMDGFEVCEQLQELFGDRFVPVVFLTALEGENDRARALAVGASGYLIKPLIRDILLDTVAKHLDLRQKWSQVSSGNSSADRQLNLPAFVDYVAEQVPLSNKALLMAAKPEELYAAARKLGIADNRLARLIAEFMGFGHHSYIDPDAIKLEALPASFSRANKVVVLEDGTVVLSNPFDMLLMDSLAAVMEQQALDCMAVAEPLVFEDMLSKSAVEYWADRFVATGISIAADDIHLEPETDNLVASLRAKGSLVHRVKIRAELGPRIISRFKALSGMNISEKRSPQIGAYTFDYALSYYRLRVATIPTPRGEALHVRLLDPGCLEMDVASLGMEAGLGTKVTTELGATGLFLFVGANGAGKTTTVSSVVNTLSRSKAIISVENPIEYNLANVNQQQVNSKAGNDEQQLLASALLKMPDMVFLGEIRDKATALAAMSCARKGTAIVSTMAAASIVSALEQLLSLGFSQGEIVEYVAGVVSQRLVRKLCPHCHLHYPVAEKDVRKLSNFGIESAQDLYRPGGCSKCANAGYEGYTALYAMVSGDKLRAAFAPGQAVGVAMDAVKQVADQVLVEQSRAKLISGRCDLREILAVLKQQVSAIAAGSVLVVDDDENMCKLVQRYLAGAGYDVTLAGDGFSALLELGQKQYDLVLSDINMPALDGNKLAELMEQKGINTPVLLISAADNLASPSPVAHRLAKPFTQEELLTAVRMAVMKR